MNLLSRLILITVLFGINLQSVNSSTNKSIFGEDNIFDYFELSNGFYDKLSNLTVVVASTDRLTVEGDFHKFKDEGETLQTTRNMCGGERFSRQRAQGFCSGFFVSKDIIATAGHCIKTSKDCSKASFITGFKINPSNQKPITRFHKSKVFRCQRLLTQKLTDLGAGYQDYALVLVDRSAKNIKDLREIRTEYTLDKTEELMVVGHPLGLPQKIARNGFSKNMYNESIVNTTLDTFAGNSGSPVFDEKNGDIIGILVAGGKKGQLELDEDKQCYRWVRCEKIENNARCTSNQIQLMSKIPYVQKGIVNSFKIYSLLHKRKLAEAKELLKKRYDINIRYRNKYNFLMLAIWNKDLEITSRFLAEGSRLNDRDTWGRNAFIFTAVSGWIEGAKFLIEKRAPINTVTNSGNTALITAAERGHTKYVQYLLKQEVNFKISNQLGNTALHTAALNSEELTAIALAKFPGMEINRTNLKGDLPLELAAKYKMYELVKVLKKLGAKGNISSYLNNALISFSEKGDLKQVKSLMSMNANINVTDGRGNTAIFKAWKNGHLEVAAYLYSNGADIFKQNINKKSMWTTIKDNRFKVADLTWLKDNGYFSVESNLWHSVAKLGTLASVKYLISAGHDVNKVNERGESALSEIINQENYGPEEASKLRHLLLNRADPNIAKYTNNKDDPTSGWTALHFAINKKNTDAATDLFRGCIDLYIEDAFRYTAYDYAVKNKTKRLFKKIFKKSKQLCKEGVKN